MELKVWVEGIQRIVCGVTESTTCQDVVLALAHATGKIGRFTLIERWRNNERLLSPQEYPLKILMKWGEYSNDIQFILRRSDNAVDTNRNNQNGTQPRFQPNSNLMSNNTENNQSSPKHNALVNSKQDVSPSCNPVGIVKGIQQQQVRNNVIENNDNNQIQKDVPPYRDPPPPYRSPPAPQSNNKTSQQTRTQTRMHVMSSQGELDRGNSQSPEAVAYSSQYKDLVSLVNYQREKLTNQQADLIKFDAEIGYWESRGREQDRQVELLQQQINTADNQLRISSEQVQALTYLEEESEIVKQNEKMLKSEVMLVRSKLANCETELLQCKAKIRKLMDEIQHEQKMNMGRSIDNRQIVDRGMLAEMESLQNQIQQAKHAADINHLTAEALKREVGVLETAILEKKRQVEQLVKEMKEANLESLAGSADDLRYLVEGTHKPGSARRIIGSPRQLENAVPTNKNPHGVWV